jgi:hypothetical protein
MAGSTPTRIPQSLMRNGSPKITACQFEMSASNGRYGLPDVGGLSVPDVALKSFE